MIRNLMILASLIPASALAQAHPITISEVERLGAAAHRLPAFRCTVIEKVTTDEETKESPNTTSWGVRPGRRSYSFAYQGGKYRIDIDQPGSKPSYINRDTKIVDGDRLIQMYNPVYRGELLMGQGHVGKLRGLTVNPLSFAHQVENYWLDEFFKKVHDVSVDESPNGSLKVSGINDQGGRFEATFDPKQGDLMTSIRLYVSDGSLVIERVVEKAQRYGDSYLPVEMVQRIVRIVGGKRVQEKQFRLSLRKVEIGPLPNEMFTPKWIKNSVIKDGDTNVVYVAQDGKLRVHPGFHRPKNLFYQLLGWLFIVGAGGLIVLLIRRTFVARRTKTLTS